MAGAEDAYVEESLAGKIFLAYHGLEEDMNRAKDIFDKTNTTDKHTGIGKAGTALWATQLNRESRRTGSFFHSRCQGIRSCTRNASWILIASITTAWDNYC